MIGTTLGGYLSGGYLPQGKRRGTKEDNGFPQVQCSIKHQRQVKSVDCWIHILYINIINFFLENRKTPFKLHM